MCHKLSWSHYRLIERLSIELTKEYGEAFNKSSLWRMIQFYECFPIVASVKRELSCTHYRYIMRVKNPVARDYYINEVITRQLSVRELECLIKTNTYEREKSNQITYEENKTIGLILVKENNEIVIKYSSLLKDKSIYVSIYKDYLPSKEEMLKIIKKIEKN